jgi:hypothetical protein
MRYLILGKNIASGVQDDDSGALNKYFELGWELVGSRIDFIRKINDNPAYLHDTTVITPSDRMFFYTLFAPKVESSEFFFAEKINQLKPQDEIEDWTESLEFAFLNVNSFVSEDSGEYVYASQDLSLIRDGFDLGKASLIPVDKTPFVVISLRFRDHVSRRNSAPRKAVKLVGELRKNGIQNVYIFGRGSERIADEVNATFISRLDEFAFLIKHDGCLGVIGQSSGPMVLALITTPKLICIIDQTGAADLEGNNAVLGGRCIQFGGGKIRKFSSITRKHRKEITHLLHKELASRNKSK